MSLVLGLELAPAFQFMLKSGSLVIEIPKGGNFTVQEVLDRSAEHGMQWRQRREPVSSVFSGERGKASLAVVLRDRLSLER